MGTPHFAPSAKFQLIFDFPDKVTTGFREQMPRRPEERLQDRTGQTHGGATVGEPHSEYPNLIDIKWKQMEANGDEIPQARVM